MDGIEMRTGAITEQQGTKQAVGLGCRRELYLFIDGAM